MEQTEPGACPPIDEHTSPSAEDPESTRPDKLQRLMENGEESTAKVTGAEQDVQADSVHAVLGDTPGTADDRPTDDQILTYENELRAQQLQKPLLGSVEPLLALEEDYAQGSQVFVSKIHSLRSTYASLRRTRQDGNCFYRSFLFGCIEGLMARRDQAEIARMTERFKGWRTKMMDVGFQELVFEDALDLVVSLLQEIKEGNLTICEVELRMCDENVSAYMIMLIRMITSCEIQRRSDHFLPFVIGMTDGCMELEDFCRRHVEAMGEESDHIQLVAVADAFQVHVRVVYLDNSGELAQSSSDSLSCHIHDFKPEQPVEGAFNSMVHVLYRPGHYDILYPI